MLKDHEFRDVINEMNNAMGCPARIGKDGRRVLCAARTENTPDGKTVFRCGAELGQIGTDAHAHLGNAYDANGRRDEPNDFGPANFFVLGEDFGPDRLGTYWKTARAHHRMYGPETTIAIIQGELRKGDAAKARLPPQMPLARGERSVVVPWSRAPARVVRRHDRTVSIWGHHGMLCLPLAIRCPKCKGLNSITDSLIESAPLQIEAG
jgi:hypothetical protein